MKSIFYKELRSYFFSPIGYIFGGVFLILCALFFVSGSLLYQTADLTSMFSNINVVYLFLVSILTMRLFSEERNKKTDQLLYTSPVSLGDIVLGKYMAAMAVFGITLALSLVFPMTLYAFGNPSGSEILGAYIGFILLWGAFISVGLFISALTESQMIAAVVTFGTLLLVYYIDQIAAGITNPAIKSFLQFFSLMRRYNEFQNGIVNLAHVIYDISFIVLFIFLTVMVLKGRRYSDKKSKTGLTILTAIVVAGILLLNGIVSVVTAKIPLKADLTHDKVYSFSQQTKEVMANLTEPVDVYALYPDTLEGDLIVAIKEYLSQYEAMNKNFKVTYKDPYEDPSFVRQYGTNAGVGTVIIQKGEKYKTLPLNDLYTQNSDNGQVSVDMEQQITNALMYVNGSGKDVNVYFTQGHNEFSAGQLKNELSSSGYTVNTINIALNGIPENTNLLICEAPENDFTQEERDMLDAYLQRGGKAAFIFTAGTPVGERLGSYLSEWGITPHNDYVIETDTDRSYRSQNGIPAPAPIMEAHEITQQLLERDNAFIAPVSCSFGISETNPQYAQVTSLLNTSKKAFGTLDFESQTMQKKEGDFEGPLSIAAYAEKMDSGSILVLGSLQSVEWGGILSDSSYANGDFILNAFSYMTDKGEVLNIRPKVISPENLTMTEKQVKTVSILLQYVLPLLILAAGLIVWLRRRYL